MPALSRQSADWLSYFTQNPHVRINYRTLMEKGVSRRKSLAILKELREHNHIKIVKLVGGGTNVKLVTSDVTTVVTSGIAVVAVQPISSIYNSSIASTSRNATYFSDEVGEEGKSVGYDFFDSTSSGDDELIREREKHMAQKKAEYAEAKAKTADKRNTHRSQVDPLHWTSKDVAYEFATRMADFWSIAPFSVTQSRFVQSLGVFRKQHDTNGALELKMIEMFFSTLKAEKYKDGNHLWHAFMYKAPMLLQSAREQVVSAEDIQTAIVEDSARVSKKLALLEDDDV